MARRPATKPHKTTTVREFNGGWNAVDSELNLTPKFAKQLDNFVRAADGSIQIRYGTKFYADCGLTQNVDRLIGPVQVAIVSGEQRLFVGVPAGEYGLSDPINILAMGTNADATGSFTIGGLSSTLFVGSKTVVAVGGVPVNSVAVNGNGSLASSSQNNAAVYVKIRSAEGLLTADIVNGTFFQDYLILVDAKGNIARISSTGVGTRIWDKWIAYARTGHPTGWSNTDFVSFSTFGGKLHVFNGIDKPLVIDMSATNVCDYLVDPASGSNSAIPAAKFGKAAASYMVLSGSPGRKSILDISAKLTSGVYSGNVDPDDAVDLDMSKIANAVDSEITGLGEIRDKIVVAFRDTMSIGNLGITKEVGTSILHDPQFKDNINQQGCVSHRTIVSLGNDLFMCDRVGVPSLSQSQLSGFIVPDRVSDLIEPEIQKNITRLSALTLQNKVFALFNPRDRLYMLFMPKFDETAVTLPSDPITFAASIGNDKMLINFPAHEMDIGDSFTLAASSAVGSNLATSINKTWKVWSVPDKDYIIVQSTTPFAQLDITGGGRVITATRAFNETIGYIYAYNPKLKIRAWSRFRGMKWQWGAVDVYGRCFFGNGRKVYQYGSTEDPIASDYFNDYDVVWSTSTAYTVGQRVYDANSKTSWTVLLAHTSPASGTLLDDYAANPTRWEPYDGTPISFAWEWPWSDFDKRVNIKRLESLLLDADGSAEFSVNVFTDLLYKDNITGKLNPQRSMQFIGSGASGYGRGDQPYGGGRGTREQRLWRFPIACKLLKLRFEGETTKPLRIIAVSLLYHDGGIKR